MDELFEMICEVSSILAEIYVASSGNLSQLISRCMQGYGCIYYHYTNLTVVRLCVRASVRPERSPEAI